VPDDPPNKILIDAVLDGLKQKVIFLVDNEVGPEGIDRLVKKTERLAFAALVEQFGDDAARKFFVNSENAWVLRTTFGGWVFFSPVDMLSPTTSMDGLGQPDFVYWPNVEGEHARVPWQMWATLRERGNLWRPPPGARTSGPKTVWDRLRDP
jgi:hypothetical protein